MKDVSSSSRSARTTVYSRKRASPNGGVSKSRGRTSSSSSSLFPSHSQSAVAKADQAARRQRQAQVARYHQQGIYIEEEYREEICAYMHERELATMGCTTSMDQQPEIKWHMRPCLVDFLVEVHFTYRLRPEVLYLTMNILDRYVSRRVVYIKHYQLVGCAALWIAAKFEDAKERVPTVQDLVEVCRNTYDESAFIQMEYHVLETLGFSMGHPTAEAWLRLVLCGFNTECQEVEHTARFLMEITLFYREFVQHPPSSIAVAALTLARHICGQTRRIYEETEEIMEIVDALDERLATSVNELSETLVQKYAFGFFSKASTNVVRWYLGGGRFTRFTALPSMPATPTRSIYSLATTTPPLSAGSSTSDLSDMEDMPPTPSELTTVPAPFVEGVYDKENLPSTFTIVKHAAEPVPDEFLPHDYVTYGRPALHTLNHLPSSHAGIS